MTLKEFEDYVREELESGVEYADIIKLAFSVDTDDDPAGELFVQFGQHEYALSLTVGEDGKPGIHTYDYSTITLSQESIFEWCLFESHKRFEQLRAELAEVQSVARTLAFALNTECGFAMRKKYMDAIGKAIRYPKRGE